MCSCLRAGLHLSATPSHNHSSQLWWYKCRSGPWNPKKGMQTFLFSNYGLGRFGSWQMLRAYLPGKILCRQC